MHTRRTSAIWGLWKIYKCSFIQNCTRKIMWLLINKIHEKISQWLSRRNAPVSRNQFHHPGPSRFIWKQKISLAICEFLCSLALALALTNQIHHYNTRNSNSFCLFSCRTNIWQFAIRFQGPKLFNSFGTEIQNADSFSQFKS